MPDPSYQQHGYDFDRVVDIAIRGTMVEALLAVDGRFFVRQYPLLSQVPRAYTGSDFASIAAARRYWFKRYGVALSRKLFA